MTAYQWCKVCGRLIKPLANGRLARHTDRFPPQGNRACPGSGSEGRAVERRPR